MAAKNSSLKMVASGMVLTRLVSKFRVCDPDSEFSELGIVDILLVAVADESEIDILVGDRLVAASWAGNYFDIGLDSDLNSNSEFGTGDQGFNIDFLIVGYLDAGDSQFGYVIVYHNSDRYAFPVATVDWLMKMPTDEISVEELTFTANNKFKVATASDITTLEYYQSIYTHCKQRFEICNGIIAFKKTLFQYIKNQTNDYLFGNYNITTVKRDLLENILHYSNTESENISAEACATYFEELDYNIIRFCEEKYPPNTQFAFELESEPETSSNKRQKDNQPVHTTLNTPKISFKYLQTPEQGTSSKLPLTITLFPASLAQAQTPNSPLNQFARPEDFTLLRSPIRQQKPLQTSSNLLDFLAENQSEHSETAANEENNSEITEEESIDSENEEDEMTTYIAKIPDFNGENIETSPQEWLDQVTKAGDANGWNATRMLRTIPYFLKGTAGKWFENLAAPFNDWNAFKAAFLEQFTDNNTSITLCNRFRNIKQELSESTNNYYSDAQILDQFIAGLKDKLIKKIRPHAPEDLNSAIQHAKRYEMAMEEANHTKLVNLAIEQTSSAAEEKIDQLTKKVENYFTNQQQQRYQPPQRQIQNNFAPLSNNQPQNCHYYCRKLQQDQQNRDNQRYSSPQQSYYQLSPPAYYSPRPQYQNNYYQPAPQPIQQQYQQPPTQYYQIPARRLITQNQFTPQN
ncbi:hypothetical protein G9A89_005444 [Geosiphon pyriformis]|nr:hypothetical protein G9A89_005444 [Geosiphon pyriformis]